MSEAVWAMKICDRLHDHLKAKNPSLAVDTEQKLMYSFEIFEYDEGEVSDTNDQRYKTDILVYEWIDEKRWVPRVVIETKYKSVNTHDSITYSKKSHDHKSLHPYLRYGIFLGNMSKPEVPTRLIRHGLEFDFMVAWDSDDGTASEWNELISIIEYEIQASREMELILKNLKRKPSTIHKRLVIN